MEQQPPPARLPTMGFPRTPILHVAPPSTLDASWSALGTQALPLPPTRSTVLNRQQSQASLLNELGYSLPDLCRPPGREEPQTPPERFQSQSLPTKHSLLPPIPARPAASQSLGSPHHRDPHGWSLAAWGAPRPTVAPPKEALPPVVFQPDVRPLPSLFASPAALANGIQNPTAIVQHGWDHPAVGTDESAVEDLPPALTSQASLGRWPQSEAQQHSPRSDGRPTSLHLDAGPASDQWSSVPEHRHPPLLEALPLARSRSSSTSSSSDDARSGDESGSDEASEDDSSLDSVAAVAAAVQQASEQQSSPSHHQPAEGTWPANSIGLEDRSPDSNIPASQESQDSPRSPRLSTASWMALRDSLRHAAITPSRKAWRIPQPPIPLAPPTSLLFHTVTWNMNLRAPPESAQELLGLKQNSAGKADFYAIATQECSAAYRSWELKLQEELGLSYVLLASAEVNAVHLVVFVRRDYLWFVELVESSTVATSMVRNKGGVGVSILFYGYRLLFVSSHLTAHQEKVKERNENYHAIRRGLQLPSRRLQKDLDMTATLSGTSTSLHSFNSTKGRDVCRFHDATFWMGDLNYRLEASRDLVDYLLRKEELAELLARDQLLRQQKEKEAFDDFLEADIRFSPTYKYDVGTDNFDSSSKQRVPAWTDRILWHSPTLGPITCLQYDSIAAVTSSDHKPVFATFSMPLLARLNEASGPTSPALGLSQTSTRLPTDGPGTYDLDAYVYGNQRHVSQARSLDPADMNGAHSEQLPTRGTDAPLYASQAWASPAPPIYMLTPGTSVCVLVGLFRSQGAVRVGDTHRSAQNKRTASSVCAVM